ncbi:M23 family metallopeptidase [Fodinisporobacter ferrooxydans]|uniref:M23 family metallopeptidase n=1 Tax=Fodinisporobacter ferrooxydans TaxID=2901836 RepID=A0ABY4CQB7_9BACL|nr:M23 family metallopeptidase [Alicyclobacillaceae bacterium MYW30-H2]
MRNWKTTKTLRLLFLTLPAMINLQSTGFCATSVSANVAVPGPTAPIPAWIEQLSKQTGLNWYDIAAIHQYEFNIHKKNNSDQQTHIYIPDRWWSGLLNPHSDETNPGIIRVFGGIGQDADGDGQALRTSRNDVTQSFFSYLAKNGTSEKKLEHTLLQFYEDPNIVTRIEEYREIFKHSNSTSLQSFVFPIPVKRDYSYKDTWGDGRSWGGRRIHEGTDIFAPYGTPVLSVTYGYIESLGWNKYGGWRVGIRTVDNLYFYYAHLSGYAKGIKQGTVVKPGEVIGYVGSSGYGKIGTSGKFPPHLHFGMYKDTGKHEWAFDPYPNLRRWEQAVRKRR